MVEREVGPYGQQLIIFLLLLLLVMLSLRPWVGLPGVIVLLRRSVSFVDKMCLHHITSNTATSPTAPCRSGKLCSHLCRFGSRVPWTDSSRKSKMWWKTRISRRRFSQSRLLLLYIAPTLSNSFYSLFILQSYHWCMTFNWTNSLQEGFQWLTWTVQ